MAIIDEVWTGFPLHVFYFLFVLFISPAKLLESFIHSHWVL